MRNRAATWVNLVFASIIVIGVFVQVYLIASYAMGAGEDALDMHGFVGGLVIHGSGVCVPRRTGRLLGHVAVDLVNLGLFVLGTVQIFLKSRRTRTRRAGTCTACTGFSPCSCSSTRRTSRTATCAGSGFAVLRPGSPRWRPVRQTRFSPRVTCLPMQGGHRRPLRAARTDRERRDVERLQGSTTGSSTARSRSRSCTRISRRTRSTSSGSGGERAPSPQLSHPSIVTVIDRGEDEGRQFIVFEYVEERTSSNGSNGPNRWRCRTRSCWRSNGQGAGLRARTRADPPRREAAERAAERGQAGEDDRLRDCTLGRRPGRDDHGDRSRNERVHRARAGARPARSTPRRTCTRWSRSLRAARRRRAVRGETFVTVALKHVNEPVPPVLERRPDLSPRVALAVERAMAKSPDDQFSSMQELIDELEICLAELEPGDEQATMISRRPVAAKQARQPRRRKRRLGMLWPIAAVLAVLTVAGLAALGALALRGDDDDPQAAPTRPIERRASRPTTRTATTPSTTTRPAWRPTATCPVLADGELPLRPPKARCRPRPRCGRHRGPGR